MTRHDSLKCLHEPFGDAFYYGPERLSSRFEDDEKARIASGFQQSTFRTIFDRIEGEAAEVRGNPPYPGLIPWGKLCCIALKDILMLSLSHKALLLSVSPKQLRLCLSTFSGNNVTTVSPWLLLIAFRGLIIGVSRIPNRVY